MWVVNMDKVSDCLTAIQTKEWTLESSKTEGDGKKKKTWEEAKDEAIHTHNTMPRLVG
jgi:hypothetical protein